MSAAETFDYPQFKIGEKIWYVKEYIERLTARPAVQRALSIKV